jgi:hypothetical protein
LPTHVKMSASMSKSFFPLHAYGDSGNDFLVRDCVERKLKVTLDNCSMIYPEGSQAAVLRPEICGLKYSVQH